MFASSLAYDRYSYRARQLQATTDNEGENEGDDCCAMAAQLMAAMDEVIRRGDIGDMASTITRTYTLMPKSTAQRRRTRRSAERRGTATSSSSVPNTFSIEKEDGPVLLLGE